MRTRVTLAATIATAAAAGALLLPVGAAADGTGGFETCSPGCDIVVNSTVDEPDADPGDGACATAAGDCTLRAAVQEANSAGVANVMVPPGTYTLTRHGLDDDAARGDLDVTFEGRLVGSGRSRTIVDGDEADRVFDVRGGLELWDFTVRHGRATDGAGGGIRVVGGWNADLAYLQVIDNEAVAGAADRSGEGGGIATFRDTLVRSTQFASNRAVDGGGMYWSGAQAGFGGNSFIANHASRDGGGLWVAGADSGFGATTISGNRADGRGGGAYVTGYNFDLTGSTIASNSAPRSSGGGLWVQTSPGEESPQTVKGTIVAGNAGGDCAGPGWFDSLGGNIDGDGSCGFTHATDLARVDPLLDDPAYNGGPVQTRALEDGSPAIDLWSNCGGGADARGVTRPAGACDAGAFEVDDCCPAYEPPDVPAEEQPPPPKEGSCGVIRMGTSGADVLQGDRRTNQIYGRAGNDRIYGRFQADCLYGGTGNDFVRGGEGTDLLVGFWGDDHLSGGDGEDVIRGGRGRDRILGGADEDRLFGGPGADYIKGGGGYDTIDAGPGDDTIDATGQGLDTVDCGPGVDSVRADRHAHLRACEHVRYVD